MKTINFGTGLTQIYGYAFRNCSGLDEFAVPETVTSLGQNAFQGCSSLQTATLPDDLSDIGKNQFMGCTSLSRVNIPSVLTAIPEGMFSECTALTETDFELPRTVTSIGNSAFSGCTGFTKLNLPNSITEIEASAFSSCSGLTGVVLPLSVTTLGASAFNSCENLATAVLPPSCQAIPTGLFQNCLSLSRVYLGPNISEIGDEAFAGCALTDIYITAQTPPSIQATSFTDQTSATLYLQGEEAEADYKAAEIWSEFANVKQMNVADGIDVKKIDDSANDEEATGDTVRYKATLVGTNVSIPYVFWRSSDPSVAYVDSKGVVTLLAGGDDVTPATITAESLYADGPVHTITGDEDITTDDDDDIPTTGLEAIAEIDNHIIEEIYTLNGVSVGSNPEDLTPGVYVCRFADGKTCKIRK